MLIMVVLVPGLSMQIRMARFQVPHETAAAARDKLAAGRWGYLVVDDAHAGIARRMPVTEARAAEAPFLIQCATTAFDQLQIPSVCHHCI